ncbi:MAG: sugar ABC transporter substrate-binding protein [Zetaproteobacteria bacterium]|nr:sugar ABC transporter substrate-binding protein [Pseudobdellovibrionaceae bacterium]|tara:strand:- start:185 stop:1447 length:1263 start_codon:yes stop_codon:yes gene_type:complete
MNLISKRFLAASCLNIGLIFTGFGTSASAEEVEVLHWWTSGGEAKSMNVLKQMLEAKGHKWKDFSVAGGSGSNATTVLKSRVIAGNPPSAAQLKKMDLLEWGELDVLSNLDKVASEGKWNQVLPAEVSRAVQQKGKYIAVPVNIHRVNWMWVNPKIFKKAGAKIPSTWDEFFVAAEKIKKAGYVPLAHGGQSWQDATLFEVIAMGVGGADFYRKAFVDLDQKTLNSKKMEEVFTVFRKVRPYLDKGSAGRDWNLATSMVIKGEAAMQIMGDWAKGEFSAANKKPNKDYVCVPAPQTKDMFTYGIDSFAMFSGRADKGQRDFAMSVMDKDFQSVFNAAKGSIPARHDVDISKFDACAKDSKSAFILAEQKKNLVPSMAHGMATPAAAQGAFIDVISQFFNTPKMTVASATKAIAKAAKEAN